MVLLFEDRVHCRGEIWTKNKKAVAVDNKKNRRTKGKLEERRIAKHYVTRFFYVKKQLYHEIFSGSPQGLIMQNSASSKWLIESVVALCLA